MENTLLMLSTLLKGESTHRVDHVFIFKIYQKMSVSIAFRYIQGNIMSLRVYTVFITALSCFIVTCKMLKENTPMITYRWFNCTSYLMIKLWLYFLVYCSDIFDVNP